MTDKSASPLRSGYRDPSDLRVLARITAEDGTQKRISFPASNVDHIREGADDTAVIVLKSGQNIAISISFDTLYDKIYRPDFRQGDTLDLTASCLHIDVPKQKKPIHVDFNDNTGPLMITAQLRKPETNSISPFTFSEEDVRYYNIESTARSKSGESIRVYFNDATRKRLPFSNLSSEYVMLDMPNDDFLVAVQDAKNNGTGKLDLCTLFAANPTKYGLDPQ